MGFLLNVADIQEILKKLWAFACLSIQKVTQIEYMIVMDLHFSVHLDPMEMLSETNNPTGIVYKAAMYIMSVKCALQFI